MITQLPNIVLKSTCGLVFERETKPSESQVALFSCFNIACLQASCLWFCGIKWISTFRTGCVSLSLVYYWTICNTNYNVVSEVGCKTDKIRNNRSWRRFHWVTVRTRCNEVLADMAGKEMCQVSSSPATCAFVSQHQSSQTSSDTLSDNHTRLKQTTKTLTQEQQRKQTQRKWKQWKMTDRSQWRRVNPSRVSWKLISHHQNCCISWHQK